MSSIFYHCMAVLCCTSWHVELTFILDVSWYYIICDIYIYIIICIYVYRMRWIYNSVFQPPWARTPAECSAQRRGQTWNKHGATVLDTWQIAFKIAVSDLCPMPKLVLCLGTTLPFCQWCKQACGRISSLARPTLPSLPNKAAYLPTCETHWNTILCCFWH